MDHLNYNLQRIWGVINKFQLPLLPDEYTETASLCKFDLLPFGTAKISELLRYELEFKNLLGKNTTIDHGNGYINLIIPKQQPSVLNLLDLLQNNSLYEQPGKLKIVLGEDVDGDIIIIDLVDIKHLLIAGSTRTGKSVCIHSIVVSLIHFCSPEEIKFILIDFKGNEFPIYESLSYLLKPVVYEIEKAVKVLEWAVAEMDRRYKLMASHRCRNITSYNKTTEKKLHYIAIIIDEFADLTTDIDHGKKGESLIIKLASKAMAAGIHLIISTQTPKADIITTTIKNNLTSRISFKVTDSVASNLIIDKSGAENLVGRGDMYLKEDSDIYRIQGAFISDEELEEVIINYIDDNNQFDVPEPHDEKVNDEVNEEDFNIEIEIDDFIYFEKAARFCIENNICSRTSIQRALKKGWPIVDKVIDNLKKYRIIGDVKEGRDYPIIITIEGFESRLDDIKKGFEEEYYGL